MVTTSQTYAAQVVHNNNKYNYILVYYIETLLINEFVFNYNTISFEMLMYMSYTTSRVEKKMLRVFMRF